MVLSVEKDFPRPFHSAAGTLANLIESVFSLLYCLL